jgi:hypothetical protein
MNEADFERVFAKLHCLDQAGGSPKARSMSYDPMPGTGPVVKTEGTWKEALADAGNYSFRDASIQTNNMPWFPFTINLGEPPCSIILHADGKWEGSIEALRTSLAANKSWGGDGMAKILLWLLLRQMEADKRFW